MYVVTEVIYLPSVKKSAVQKSYSLTFNYYLQQTTSYSCEIFARIFGLTEIALNIFSVDANATVQHTIAESHGSVESCKHTVNDSKPLISQLPLVLRLPTNVNLSTLVEL